MIIIITLIVSELYHKETTPPATVRARVAGWGPAGYDLSMSTFQPLIGLLTLAAALSGCPEEVPIRGDVGLSLVDGTASPRDEAGTDARPPVDDKGPRKVDGPGLNVDSAPPPGTNPPLGGSSRGSGGSVAPGGKVAKAGSTSYIVIVPSSYSPSRANPLMIVFSGTEGASTMANNLKGTARSFGLGALIFAVIDGKATFGNGQAGAAVLDHVRQLYNIDNDRTYLLSESAGTRAGLQLGLQLRQSYFAAYWANDVNSSAAPKQSAAQLGFAPWGNAGPGGALAEAQAIVKGMRNAGYRLPANAPYSGAGSTRHGNPQQFLAALRFFVGKSRR